MSRMAFGFRLGIGFVFGVLFVIYVVLPALQILGIVTASFIDRQWHAWRAESASRRILAAIGGVLLVLVWAKQALRLLTE